MSSTTRPQNKNYTTKEKPTSCEVGFRFNANWVRLYSCECSYKSWGFIAALAADDEVPMAKDFAMFLTSW